MHRFYLTPEETKESMLTLTEREAHHALNVLRIREGERVVVLDGIGHEFLCEVRQANRQGVSLKVAQKQFNAPLSYELTLVQAITKGKTMDLIIQKATELGAHRIVPILSGRTVAHVGDDAASEKVEKWRATAIEAIKQCGSPWLPKIDLPVSPQTFLSQAERFEMSLIATLQTHARHPRAFFQAFLNEQQRLPKTLCVWVGPEGDFTPAETNAVISAGALPITLGNLILRSETAAIYCLAVLNYEMQAAIESHY
ncbi:MAG: 16S rRNA (uracil(1498)-N(3))-methyltransferase [Pedosphaera sp.]|nr:16S rRNA (uracil(1498)-N(3))-methyltransferase [Pedosphaera sp.]